jgi:hypothetical protein
MNINPTPCHGMLEGLPPKPKGKSLLHRLFGWLWKDNPTAPSVKPMTAKDFPKFKE